MIATDSTIPAVNPTAAEQARLDRTAFLPLVPLDIELPPVGEVVLFALVVSGENGRSVFGPVDWASMALVRIEAHQVPSGLPKEWCARWVGWATHWCYRP